MQSAFTGCLLDSFMYICHSCDLIGCLTFPIVLSANQLADSFKLATHSGQATRKVK